MATRFSRVPPGIGSLMEDMAREVMRLQPETVYGCLADYTYQRLQSREGKDAFAANKEMEALLRDQLEGNISGESSGNLNGEELITVGERRESGIGTSPEFTLNRADCGENDFVLDKVIAAPMPKIKAEYTVGTEGSSNLDKYKKDEKARESGKVSDGAPQNYEENLYDINKDMLKAIQNGAGPADDLGGYKRDSDERRKRNSNGKPPTVTMGKESLTSIGKLSVSTPYAIATIIQVLLTDIVLYGCLLPLAGTYIGGVCAQYFELESKWELILTVLVTFTLIYAMFCFVGETTYWKHLFAFDKFYCILLQVRDGINGCLFILCLISLASTVEAMITEDKGMKKAHVSEGAFYVFWKTVCQYLHISEDFLQYFGFGPPHTGTILDPSFGENERYEHGAAYMLSWAALTACIAKLIYYNTLFTYLRAMEIFMSMKPIFAEDDDTVSNTTFHSLKQNRQSRLENDFLRSIRKPNWDD